MTSSIIPASSFTSALLFYLFYKEKLALRHLIGMLFMLFCIVFISLSKPAVSISLESKGWIGIPILLSLLQVFYFTLGAFVVKTAVSKGFHPFRISVDMFAWTSLFFFILFMYSHYCIELPYDTYIFFYVVMAGFTFVCAVTL